MNKFAKISLVALLASTTLTACGKSSSSASSANAQCPIKVGFVTDMGGIEDRSFNQSSWEGIQKFAKDNNLSESCISYVESKAEADYVPNLSAMADKGNHLVVAAGFLFSDAVKEVSKNYPNTNFFVIDTVVDEPNVVSGIFKDEQISYLAGIAAALQAKAEGGNSVGFIGGQESELIRKFQAGFEQGALSVNPDIQIFVDYVMNFDDTTGAQTAAQKQYNKGAKVIYHAAGNAGNGVIKEAKERVEKGEKVWVVGTDSDQYDTGKMENGNSVILTSALKRVDSMSAFVSKSVLDNAFEGGKTLEFSIKEDAIGYPTENPNLSEEIKTALDQAIADLKEGKINLHTNTIISNGSSNK